MPQNTRYSPRRKGKPSTNTLRCISFFCCHTGELSFLGGGGGGARGSFLLGRNFRVFPQIMKEGNFATATSIAAGVWFHIQITLSIAGAIDIRAR